MFFILLQSESVPQDEVREETIMNRNRICVELTGGGSVYTKTIYRDETRIMGIVGGFRLMWEPDKLLRIGIHSGYMELAKLRTEYILTEFGETKRSNKLTAYPIAVIFNMKVSQIELILGLGAGFVTSQIRAFDEESVSTIITSLKLYGVGYMYNINKEISVGAEVKYYSYSTPEVTSITFEIKGKYALLEW